MFAFLFHYIIAYPGRCFKPADRMPSCFHEALDAEQEKKKAGELVDFLDAEISRSLTLSEQQRQVFIQYLVFGKSFEDTPIDYYKIYRHKYLA